MDYSRARKHYRAAKREAAIETAKDSVACKGIFITEEKKYKLVMYCTLMTVLIFIKGIIIGNILANYYGWGKRI